MFESKLDKFLCFIMLLANFAYYGYRFGTQHALPFVACAVLSLGLSVKESTK